MLTWAAGNRRWLSVSQARAWQRLQVLCSVRLTVSSMPLHRRMASAGFTLLELFVGPVVLSFLVHQA